jgi:IS5 family transposase
MRVGSALIQHQRRRPRQAVQAYNRCKKLRTYLGRVIRDIACKIDGDSGLKRRSLLPLLAPRAEQQQRQRGPKVYSLHARKSNARQGQGSSALRVRRQGQRCPTPNTARAASSSPTKARPAIPMTATRWQR